MMHDSVATFYGGYDQAGIGHLPYLRIPPTQLAIGVAVLVLVLLVSSDVSLIDGRPAPVQVTAVNWYVGDQPLATTAGFTTHSSQSFVLTETCQLFCYNFDGATVSSPFQLVNLAITNMPVQYTNLTIRAPGSAYDGSLTITLELG